MLKMPQGTEIVHLISTPSSPGRVVAIPPDARPTRPWSRTPRAAGARLPLQHPQWKNRSVEFGHLRLTRFFASRPWLLQRSCTSPHAPMKTASATHVYLAASGSEICHNWAGGGGVFSNDIKTCSFPTWWRHLCVGIDVPPNAGTLRNPPREAWITVPASAGGRHWRPSSDDPPNVAYRSLYRRSCQVPQTLHDRDPHFPPSFTPVAVHARQRQSPLISTAKPSSRRELYLCEIIQRVRQSHQTVWATRSSIAISTRISPRAWELWRNHDTFGGRQ